MMKFYWLDAKSCYCTSVIADNLAKQVPYKMPVIKSFGILTPLEFVPKAWTKEGWC